MAFTLKAGGSCGFLYLRACAVDGLTNQAQLKDMLRLDRLPSPVGDIFRSNASVPQGLILPSSRAPQSAEQKFENKWRNHWSKTTQTWKEFKAQPAEFYNRQPVPQGHVLELLSDNIDLLLGNTERIIQAPEMAECREVGGGSPSPLSPPDLGDLLWAWKKGEAGWKRTSVEGHPLYALYIDGSILSGSCYIYILLDPVAKELGTTLSWFRPRLSEAREVVRTSPRAKKRPWKEIPPLHAPVHRGESFADWERRTQQHMPSVDEVEPHYLIPPTLTLAEIIAKLKEDQR